MGEPAGLGPRLEPTTRLGGGHAVKPFGLSWRSHTLFILSTIIIGLFSETFLYGIVVPVLPFILRDRIGISHEDLQGYSSALLAANTASTVITAPFAGAVADRFGSRKGPFMVGLAVLVAATALFYAGHSISALVVARCAQGASSAFVWTVGFALCFDSVGSENMGKTLGTVMAFVNVGALLSPPLGGILYHQAGMLAVATVSAGILLIVIIMQTLLIEKKVAARYLHGSLGSGCESSAQIPADDNQPEPREEPSGTEESPLLGREEASRDYYIGPVENRALRSAPLLLCLRNSSLVVAILASGVQSALIGSFDATIPLEANDLFGFNSLKAGLLFIPVGCLRLAMGPTGGWAVDRYGSKAVATFGYSFLVPVLISFRLVKPEPRATQIALYCVLLALCGLGMALVGTTGFVEAGAVVQRYHRRNPSLFGENGPMASLYGMNLMVFSLGMTLGPILGGVLRERIGYGNMNAVLGSLAGMSAVASFIWLGGKPTVLKSNRVERHD